jgi:hypothetical protein
MLVSVVSESMLFQPFMDKEMLMSGFKRSYLLAAVGFAAGAAVSLASVALATSTSEAEKADPYLHAKYSVSLDEVKQNFVFAEPFSDSYTHTVTMSDGTQRTIGLRPVTHNGMQVLELSDKTGAGAGQEGVTYMGTNGTTTDGKLMISVKDLDAIRAQMKAAKR